jgi:hypothetical protein
VTRQLAALPLAQLLHALPACHPAPPPPHELPQGPRFLLKNRMASKEFALLLRDGSARGSARTAGGAPPRSPSSMRRERVLPLPGRTARAKGSFSAPAPADGAPGADDGWSADAAEWGAATRVEAARPRAMAQGSSNTWSSSPSPRPPAMRGGASGCARRRAGCPAGPPPNPPPSPPPSTTTSKQPGPQPSPPPSPPPS